MRGRQHVDAASLSDPVLVREDGTYLYTLPCVVDDIELGITHVIRGEDHVTNTAPQIQLFEALGATPPAFAHHNLLSAPTGRRCRSATGRSRFGPARGGHRADGGGLLRRARRHVGPGRAACEPRRARAAFDFAQVSRAPARFDPTRASAAQRAGSCTCCPMRRCADRLAALGVGGGEAFWHAVRGNLAVLADAKSWWRVVEGAARAGDRRSSALPRRRRSAAAGAMGRRDLEQPGPRR